MSGQPSAIVKLGGWRGATVRVWRAMALSWGAGPISAIGYLLTTIVEGLLPATITLLTKWLIESIQFANVPPEAIPVGQGPPEVSPLLLVAGIGTLGLVSAVIPYLSTYLKSRLSRGVTLLVQERLYSSVNGFQGMARFENPAFLDRLQLAQQSATNAPDQVTSSSFTTVQHALTAASFLAVLWMISPIMLVVTIAAALPALFVQLSISRRQASMMWKISPRTRRQLFYQRLMVSLAAVKEIRLFGLGDFFKARMRYETKQVNAAEERMDRRVLLSQGPLAALSASVAAGGLVWMINTTLHGTFSIGDVTAFVAAVAGLQGALAGIVGSTTRAYHALLLFGHYVDVADMEPDLPALRCPRPLRQLHDQITLRDVWFRYTKDGPWVLRGVDLSIPRGGTLAVVGLNGAGKSTLVKLLCRLYDPVRGAIEWDGVDLRDLDVAQLRDRISAIFQDNMEYDLTAAENIGLGDVVDIGNRDRILGAAREAGVDGFLSALPRGYDTMLSRVFLQGEDNDGSEQGVTLSGGQWQRIALARAMMRRGRDLLILDEPSAGLDAAAEQAMHEQLRQYRAGATSVLISHRLGTVRQADRIVVLQAGQIAESGTHAQLMGNGGEYARLFQIQAANYLDVEAALAGADAARPGPE